MPIRCSGGEKARYRYTKDKTRLAWCGKRVVEAKAKSGKVHTQGEFRREARRKSRHSEGRGGKR